MPIIQPVAPESAKVIRRTLPDLPSNNMSGASLLSATNANPLVRMCAAFLPGPGRVPPCSLFFFAGRFTGAGFTGGIFHFFLNFFNQKHSGHLPFSSVFGLPALTSIRQFAGFWTVSPACGECLPVDRSCTSLELFGAVVACDPLLQG